ncbi:SDR family oxidoreductase [Spiroplasma endosymbiont of Amphibalanus improvisus]|uniref:SDR family oxidoreductase n=1 Tax=Spiroplasma endosymbiont of Amphibalanus improvisus TaxID=3066327 RepID=UPI00313DC65C
MKPLVVITGASSGIGRQAAIDFSKAGYPLLLLARRIDLLKELKLPNSICAKVDVTDVQKFKTAVEKAEGMFGPVDLLINNAGVMPLESIDVQPLSDQHLMVDINIKGVLNGMHAVIPSMKKNKHGTIINVSSCAGRYTYSDHAVYCGTKYAVHAISEQSRKELADFNIRVSIMAPAIVDTNLLVSVKDANILDSYNNIKKSINKGLKSSDISNLMLYTYELPQEVSLKEILVSATKQKI